MIYLIRHGETDWNRKGMFQGREDIALNENGIEQAKLCGKALKGEKFRAVITSPLIRAQRTAGIIAENLSIEQVVVEEDLIERDFGKISGLNPQEREAFLESDKDACMEPFEEVSNRMMSCIKRYADLYYDENIIIVSHGASINAFFALLSGGDIGIGKVLLKNTCINVVEYKDSIMKVKLYNVSWEEYLNLSK